MNCFSRVVSIIYYMSSNSFMKISVCTQTTFVKLLAVKFIKLIIFCRMLLKPIDGCLIIETASRDTWFLIKYNTHLEGANCNVYP